MRSQRPTAGPRIEVGSHVFEVGVAGAASSTLDLAWLLWFLLISPAFMANLTAKKATTSRRHRSQLLLLNCQFVLFLDFFTICLVSQSPPFLPIFAQLPVELSAGGVTQPFDELRGMSIVRAPRALGLWVILLQSEPQSQASSIYHHNKQQKIDKDTWEEA